MKVEGNRVSISFTDIGSGLVIGSAPARPGVPPSKTETELKGFAIAGMDKQWAWARAEISGDRVIVWNDTVAHPVAVRYAWGDNPECNLYNEEGLPASPFRTDDWPGLH
jgi:sialate O-acetylesterase